MSLILNDNTYLVSFLNKELGSYLQSKIDEYGVHNFLVKRYYNQSNKDNWSLIVSTCQWIQVSETALKNFGGFDGDINKRSFDFFSLIFATDMMWEAIIKLNSVLKPHSDKPFKGENDVFKNRPKILEGKDDNYYFKTLRACFGAHTVDLNLDFSDQTSTSQKVSRNFFASWPHNRHNKMVNFEFKVELWPHDKSLSLNGEHYSVTSSYDELFHFLEKRYNFILDLIIEIDMQYDSFKKKLCKKINIPGSINPIKSIEILKVESERRLDLYMYELKKLDQLFQIEENEVGPNNFIILKEHQSYCLKIIDLIRFELESFNIDNENITINEIFFPNILHQLSSELSLYGYGKEKISYVYNTINCKKTKLSEVELYGQNDIVIFHKNIDFNSIESIRGYYFLVIASEYLLSISSKNISQSSCTI